MSTRPGVLSIHAVDTAGEEGVLSDRAVFTELDCGSGCAVSAILVAGGGGITALETVSPELLARQIESVLVALRPVAARTGILRDAQQVELVAKLLRDAGIGSIVVAPVLRVSGTRVADDATLDATRHFLYPLARVVVARAGDLGPWTGTAVDGIEGMRKAAETFRAQGARSVLIAGGMSKDRVLDLLDEDGQVSLLDASRVIAPHLAGVAGAHAAALTAHLARGVPLARAVMAAQRYVALRLQRGR